MTENEIAKLVLDAAYKVHNQYGPGLLESAYEAVMAYELRKMGLHVQRQFPIRLVHEELVVDEAYRADLLVECRVLVELKAAERIAPVHSRQVLTYLRLADLRLGLLINFGSEHLKDGIYRVANGLRG